MQKNGLFTKELFGYDKKQVDEFVNDSVVYMTSLKKDIEFLKEECANIRNEFLKMQENNDIYLKSVANEIKKADAINAITREKVNNV